MGVSGIHFSIAIENGTKEWYTRLTGMAQKPLILLNF